MADDQRTARIFGVLFIITFLTSIPALRASRMRPLAAYAALMWHRRGSKASSPEPSILPGWRRALASTTLPGR
jgi:hypothetical protein